MSALIVSPYAHGNICQPCMHGLCFVRPPPPCIPRAWTLPLSARRPSRLTVSQSRPSSRIVRAWGSEGESGTPDGYELNPTQRLWGGLFGAGFVLGPLLDAIHSAAQLLIYEVAPINIGPLHSSLTVPFLLAPFYCVVGALVFFLDGRREAARKVSLRSAGLCLLSTTALVALSSVLFKSQFAFLAIALGLFVLGIAQWAFFDATLQGLGVSIACTLLAPLSELVLMHLFHVWYYPRADVIFLGDLVYGGLPSFLPFCYFFYTTWVVTLSRALKGWAKGGEVSSG